MERASGANSLSVAGRRVRRELRRYYGSPEAAEKAVREAAKDTKSIEDWASLAMAREERLQSADGEVGAVVNYSGTFSFSEIPPPLREAAIICLAAAMLAWTAEQERSAS